MKFNQTCFTLLFALMLIAPESTYILSNRRMSPQDESLVTDIEREEVRNFAKRFVARMLKTRDIAPLINEFFLADFTSYFKQDFYEKVSPALYATLSKEQRVRLFVAQENLSYFITLDVMTAPKSETGRRSGFKRFLPDSVAQRLNRSRLVEGTSEFTDRKELMNELIGLERAIVDARRVLVRKAFEQSPKFRRQFKAFEQDLYLGYRVRASIIEQDSKRESGPEGSAASQKIFRVETPIFIGMILVRDHDRLRILTLEPADGD